MIEKARILLVDDEQSVLNALQRFFRRSGYEDVVTCTSGKEGLALFEMSGPFHLVISDYRMPEMNGVEFLSAVRARWPDTVRIVLSGFADTSAIIAATNEGNIYKFIPKPWDEDFLLQSVQQGLTLYATTQNKNKQLKLLGEALDSMDALHAENLTNQSLVLTVYHTLLDQMPVGLIGIDRDFEVVSINERARQILGLAVAPLGEPVAVVLPSIYSYLSNQRDVDSENSVITIDDRQVQIISRQLHDGKMEGVMLILILLEGVK